MTVEVSELLTTLRLKDEATAGLAAANDQLRKTFDDALKAEKGVESLGGAVKTVDREFTAAGRSIGAITRGIDGSAAAAAAANRVLAQHADAVAKLRIQHEREGRTADETAEALRRLDLVRDGGLAKARAAGARIEAQFIAQGAATGQASDQLSRFASVSDQVQQAAQSMASRLGVAGSIMGSFGGIGTAAAAAMAVVGAGLYGIAKAGDQATATLGRLQAATGSVTAARDVYEALYQSSQKTGIAVGEAAGTFARFQIAAGEIGATRAQVLKLTEGLQKVAIVSGAAGSEGAAAMMQLGQALASGKLNGDELRSVMENMPSLAQALARELGTNIGQLRKLGEEGQLTADRVFPALLKATERMAGDFDKMPLTMSRAFDILGAAMLNFTAKLDEALGISQLIARAAKGAADAVNGARAALMPTEREQVQSSIGSAGSRVDTLRRQIALGTNIQSAGIGQLASPEDRTFSTDALKQQLAAAESALRTHQQRLAEIEKEGQADRFGQYVAAQGKAAEAARTRAGAEFAEAETKAQKLVKLEKDYLLEVQKTDAAERTGAVSPERIAAQRLALAREYFEDRKKIEKELAGEEDKSAKKSAADAAKEAAQRDKIIDKLETELDAKRRLSAAAAQGTAVLAAQNIEIEIEGKLREAGIPITGKRTEEEQKYADRIDLTVRALERLKVADKAAAEARTEAAKAAEKATSEIESQSKTIANDVATSIYESLVEGKKGKSVIDWFGSLFKRIAIQAASQQIFLPITTAIVGGIPQLFGIGSGGGGLAGGIGQSLGLTGSGGGLLSGLGQSLGLTGPDGLLSGLGSSLGLTGAGGLLGGTLITGWGTSTSTALGAMGGAFGPATESAVLAAGGGGVLGGAGATLGGLLGGAGAGFGAGMFLNSLLGGNKTSGTIGSGVGALGGAILGSIIPGIGTLLGGLLGGAAGGGLGGLIGPGPTVNSYGLRLQSAGFVENGANDFAGSLRPVDRRYYNESGDALFKQADQVVAAVNAYLSANNLQVAGASIIGGNKNGPDGSGFGTVGEAFANLHFRSTDNAGLSSYLGTQVFDDPAKLQAAVEGFKAADAAIKALGAEAVPEFTQQLTVINAQFDAAVEQARKYGLAEGNLTTARGKALTALEAQRTETLRQSDVALSIRRLTAAGAGQEAELAQQAERARLELQTFGESLDKLALDAADRGARILALTQTQEAERAKIIADYGEQATQALRQAGGSIRQYLDNLAAGSAAGASPTDRLTAAQAAFERDRLLATGGDRDALGRITGSADALLNAGRDVYASSGGFQDIKASVVSGLSNLPVVQSYDAIQAASLTAIQTALETGVLNTSTVILPGGNVVQLAGGIAMAGVESRLGLMIEQNQTAAAARVALHATTIQGVGILGDSFNSLFENRQVLVAAHATAINQESALYSLGLIGNATNDNLASFNTNTTASLAASNTIAASNANAIVAALNAANTIAADLVRMVAALQREVELLRAQANENAQRQMQVDHDGLQDVTTAVVNLTRPIQRAIAQ